jgi:hypothetical protein
MPDNSPSPDQGSELNPKDALYPVRVPTSIDGEPYEVAEAAVSEYIALLTSVVGYAESVEAMVRAAMLDEALTLPKDGPLAAGDVTTYPERTYELAAVVRANKAVGIAIDLLQQAEAELRKPIADSRRLVR